MIYIGTVYYTSRADLLSLLLVFMYMYIGHLRDENHHVMRRLDYPISYHDTHATPKDVQAYASDRVLQIMGLK